MFVVKVKTNSNNFTWFYVFLGFPSDTHILTVIVYLGKCPSFANFKIRTASSTVLPNSCSKFSLDSSA